MAAEMRIEKLGPSDLLGTPGPCHIKNCFTTAEYRVWYSVRHQKGLIVHRRLTCRSHAERFSRLHNLPMPTKE